MKAVFIKEGKRTEGRGDEWGKKTCTVQLPCDECDPSVWQIHTNKKPHAFGSGNRFAQRMREWTEVHCVDLCFHNLEASAHYHKNNFMNHNYPVPVTVQSVEGCPAHSLSVCDCLVLLSGHGEAPAPGTPDPLSCPSAHTAKHLSLLARAAGQCCREGFCLWREGLDEVTLWCTEQVAAS